ncbi:hypothetical protein Avbf_16587 [Armadillidium vulgare]|nr:hypothetical protein Avbf_16587 [Armadillidium vulgare]
MRQKDFFERVGRNEKTSEYIKKKKTRRRHPIRQYPGHPRINLNYCWPLSRGTGIGLEENKTPIETLKEKPQRQHSQIRRINILVRLPLKVPKKKRRGIFGILLKRIEFPWRMIVSKYHE